ncbi:hypothetical protein BASA50_002978 [Batrachochytrium salamandrivorans]|uniref:PCI domain-containing protein n=1 Tax=Batrachochytrium salamandrivorans TaxID=1357716 RepID=A0ABQ8FJN4_9FUNG|nr:hypothetical protein BASA50_002978 [Batrachochytrium salamandrivorans]KAH9276965.1 hypothetical protein BASA83_000480 [Batrachochytrium salamandrivorans]
MDTDMLDTPASSSSSMASFSHMDTGGMAPDMDASSTDLVFRTASPAGQERLDSHSSPTKAATAAAAANANAASDSNYKKKRVRVTVAVATLDLEPYISNYKSRSTRIDRLAFIAERCPSLQIDALKMAAKELLLTSNFEKYNGVMFKLNDFLYAHQLDPIAPDDKWIEQTKLASQKKTDHLEYELRAYRANSIKESIRMGHSDLGDHLFSLGELHSALKSYTRTKDYCTTQKHVLDMCLNIIKTCMSLGTFSHAQTYLIKAETIADLPNKEVLTSKLASISGIINLDSGAYRKAAKNFLSIPFEFSNELYESISPNDVAIYGGLMALATFERPELKRLVFENSHFKQYLELEPQIREMIYAFYSLNFRASIEIMGKMKNNLLLDMYLHDHVENLYQLIRKRALVQYFYPFVTVDMNKMATSFNCSVSELEREVATLIGDGHIQARIDSHNKILCAKQKNQRSQLYTKTSEIVKDYAFQSRVALLRARLLEMDLVSQPAPRR